MIAGACVVVVASVAAAVTGSTETQQAGRNCLWAGVLVAILLALNLLGGIDAAAAWTTLWGAYFCCVATAMIIVGGLSAAKDSGYVAEPAPPIAPVLDSWSAPEPAPAAMALTPEPVPPAPVYRGLADPSRSVAPPGM